MSHSEYVMDSEFHIPKKSRVRLRNAIDPAFYGPYACVGNEGWIAERRLDRLGYPEVRIHWDKNHWAYNGVEDGWTLENHFEPVEERTPMAESPEDELKRLRQVVKRLNVEAGEASDPIDPDAHKAQLRAKLEAQLAALDEGDEDPAMTEARYHESVQEAANLIEGADAFIVVGIAHRDDMLVPFVRGYSKTSESELLVTSQLSGIAAQQHQSLALQAIAALHETDEGRQ